MNFRRHALAREPSGWLDSVAARLRRHWLLKGTSTMVGITLFMFAYFAVMHLAIQTVTVMPFTRLDALVPFFPPSFALYVSLWLYVSIAPALAKDRRELAVYGACVLAMSAIGLSVFALLPTKVPDPAIDWSRYPYLAFLKTADVAGNACPSLHASFAVFTAVVLQRALAAMRAPAFLMGFNALWCLGILWSTLATRQHVLIDVLGGAVLATVASIAYVTLQNGLKAPAAGLPLARQAGHLAPQSEIKAT